MGPDDLTPEETAQFEALAAEGDQAKLMKFINGLSMSESIRKQKLLSAMHELSLEIENLNSVGKLLD